MRKMFKRKGLVFTIIPLVLCISLFAGFTLAWFTGDAENKENNIQAGTLKLDLLKYDNAGKAYKTIGEDKLFDDTYWEPGTTKIAFLAVKNVGTLAFDYSVKLTVEQGAVSLTDVMEYAIISPMNQKDASKLTSWNVITASKGAMNAPLAVGEQIVNNNNPMKAGTEKYFMLAIHMKDNAPAKYQAGWLDLDLEVVAKQMTGENDYFGSQYDKNSQFVNSGYTSADWVNLIKGGPLHFENGMEGNWSMLNGQAVVVDDATRAASQKVLKLNPGDRTQFNQGSNVGELTAGHYRVTGFVKLGDVDPAKVSITVWARKNSLNGTNLVSPTMEESIVVKADKNGWAYFEMEFDHTENYSVIQFIFNNGDAEKAIYFDNVEYQKYVGKTPRPSLAPQPLDPSDPNWETYVLLDYEGSKFPMVAVNDKYVNGDQGVPGYGDSFQCLRLEAKEQTKFSRGRPLEAGHYRVSGYVKMGDVKPSQVNFNVWAYTGTTVGNLKSGTMETFIVGEPDAEGWAYFEIDFEHKVNYTLMQFVIANYNTGATVYFDDIRYAKYKGEGAPAPTDKPDQPVVPVGPWTEHVKLDFEGEFPMVQNGDYVLGSAATPGYNGNKSLELTASEQAKYAKSGVSLAPGYYRLSGYVKLNKTKTNQMFINIWSRGEGKNVLVGGDLTNLIIGEPDANGWYYFECDFEHKETYSLIQFVVSSYSSTPIYFDDIVYSQYNLEGVPPATQPGTPSTPPTPPTPSVPTWEEQVKLDFEGTFPMVQNGDKVLGSAATPGYNSNTSLELTANEQAKYAKSGVSLTPGYYRVSGYVKAPAAKLGEYHFNIWARGIGANSVVGGTMNNLVVGEADANGWYYFEYDFEHKETYSLIQFVIASYSTSAIYFDDISYTKYNGEGVPPATVPTTPSTPPTPSVPTWEEQVKLDFEGTFPMVQNGDKVLGSAATPGYNSNTSLELTANEQAKYAKSGVSLTPGYYRVSGYVKAPAAKLGEYHFNIWARGIGANSVVGGTMNNLVVGEADANGWYYFEYDFEHKETYSLIQFVIASYSTSAIYFDDISYTKYNGEGVPPATVPTTPSTPPTPSVPTWEEQVKLDFEGTFPMVQNGDKVLGSAATPGYNSNTSLELTANEQAKYAKSGVSLTPGYYRVSGYVKVNPAKISEYQFNIWSRGIGQNAVVGGTLSNLLVGKPDDNGWYYFECDFEHKETYSLIQFVIASYSTSAIYFDDISYSKYNGDGAPPATVPPQTGHWENMLPEVLTFETGSDTSKMTSPVIVDDTSRAGSQKVLSVADGSYAHYSNAGIKNYPIDGTYMLCGWFKTEKEGTVAQVKYWAMGANGSNSVVNTNLTGEVIKKTENGWSYFEVPCTIYGKPTSLTFRLDNRASGDVAGTVYYDDVQFMKYVED